MGILDDYFDQVIGLIGDLKNQKSLIEKLASEIVVRTLEGRQVIVFGNGGSAATASHFVGDLSKGAGLPGKPKVKALCLTDNIPLVTAWANDESYESIFAEQLKVYLKPEDLVIAISCSGNSPNVLKAVNVARESGTICFGLCGFDGGELARIVDYAIVIPGKHIQQAEDVHLVILHLVSLLVKEKLGK